jgi:hypothetical protein
LARRDPSLACSTCVAKRFRRLQILHQSGHFLERRSGQAVKLRATLFGDVLPVDGVLEMVLGFHERRACYDGEPRKIRRIEAPEAFGDVRRRTRHGILQLPAQLPVSRQRRLVAQTVNRFFIVIAGLPRSQVHEPPHAMSHAASEPQQLCRKKSAVFRACASSTLRFLPRDGGGNAAEIATCKLNPNLEP